MGHAARSIQVLQAIPDSIPLFVKSGVGEWFFWQEVRRPFNFTNDVFDCGSIENARGIDREASLRTYASITERNAARLDAEVEWLRSIGARCMVTDIASFPLKAASKAGIPGFLVANFTWVDIYEPYAAEFPRYLPILSDLRGEYRLAEQAFVTPPSLPMPYLHKVHNVGMIARKGRNRRAELAASHGLDESRPLVLCYPGNYSDFRWRGLGEMSDYVFLTFANVRGARPGNLITLEQGRFSHQDIVASVDAVVAKAGYGMVGESMCNGKPMLYTGREQFAEFPVLEKALKEWGGAIRIPQKEFRSGHWKDALERLLAMKPEAVKDCNGAREVAEALARIVED